MKTNLLAIVAFLLCLGLLVTSCTSKRARAFEDFEYAAFKDSLSIENYDPLPDSSNLFDDSTFTPGIDSVQDLLVKVDTLWKLESDMISALPVLKRIESRKQTRNLNDSIVLFENMRVLDSFLIKPNDTLVNCRGKQCAVYAEVVKAAQKLYLYLDGILVDSFKVSTGIKGYETPEMNVRPSGPLFIRYTSRKFPGGNYEGLGNMPYAVFIKGGYAIHGTTPGNFLKLGTTASHGCIRLHPGNAKLFYELVRRAGLQNSWVRVVNDVPME